MSSWPPAFACAGAPESAYCAGATAAAKPVKALSHTGRAERSLCAVLDWSR